MPFLLSVLLVSDWLLSKVEAAGSFLPEVSLERVTDGSCDVYQNTVDNVFVCNGREVYGLPKTAIYEQASFNKLSNVYAPDLLGLKGEIEAVFPSAGDLSKTYLIDAKQATVEPSLVLLELFYADDDDDVETDLTLFSDGDIESYQIRKVLDFPQGISDIEWLKFSDDNKWLFVLTSDDAELSHTLQVLRVDYFTADERLENAASNAGRATVSSWLRLSDLQPSA